MPGDADYAKVSLLLQGNAAAGSQDFVDGSPRAKVMSPSGAGVVISATAKYGSGSVQPDGTDYVSCPAHDDFNFGTADFTIEGWLKTTSSTSYATIFSKTSSGFGVGSIALVINYASSTTGDVAAYAADYSSGVMMSTTGCNVRDDAWHHIAWVREAGVHYLYVDGVERATRSWAGAITDLAQVAAVGGWVPIPARNLGGKIDDLRVTKGLARYTGAFTPPTAEFDDYSKRVAGVIRDAGGGFVARAIRAYSRTTGLMLASGRSDPTDGSYLLRLSLDEEVFRVVMAEDPTYDVLRASVKLALRLNGADDSTTLTDLSSAARTVTCQGNAKLKVAQKKFGSASLYLDGTSGCYASSATDVALAFGTADFCVDLWVYQTTRASATACLFDTLTVSGVGSRNNSFRFGISSTGTVTLYFASSVRINAGFVALNSWTHLALERVDGVFTAYVDGRAVGTSAVALNDTLGGLVIGTSSEDPTDTAYKFIGYIDDLRSTNGTGRFRAPFDPPAYEQPDPANATEVMFNDLIDRVFAA